MDTDRMFTLADRLRALRDEKAEADKRLKEIKEEMDEVDYQLSELMAESETQNFTRAGMMFCLTTKTHASATAGRKEELFAAAQRLVRDRAACRELGAAAYRTILGTWNAENAGERLLELTGGIVQGM